jgi:hypothetical protein
MGDFVERVHSYCDFVLVSNRVFALMVHETIASHNLKLFEVLPDFLVG